MDVAKADGDWALESNHQYALQPVQNVLDYNKAHH
jgi:hypothetical protein